MYQAGLAIWTYILCWTAGILCSLRHHRVVFTCLAIESHLLILLTSDHTSSPWMEATRESVPLTCLAIESQLLILLTSDHTSSPWMEATWESVSLTACSSSPWMEAARQSVLLPLYCTSSTRDGNGVAAETPLYQQQVGESHSAAKQRKPSSLFTGWSCFLQCPA